MPGNRALALFALAALLLAVPAALAQVPPQAPEAPQAPIVEPLAQPAQEQAEQQAEGNISAVDAENSTITVSTAEGEELVLNVTESARITKDGVEELGMGSSGLKQLATGDHVSVAYNKDTMEAQGIDLLSGERAESGDATQQPEKQAENETSVPVDEMPVIPEEIMGAPASEAVEGKVTGVNKENNILVLQTQDGKYLAFRLADNTSVVSEGGQEAGIEELSYGKNVSVKYDEKTRNATEVVVRSAMEEVPPEENATAPVEEPAENTTTTP